MKFLIELFWHLVGEKVETSVALFKIDAAITYLNVIKGTRRMAMLLCLMVLGVAVLACGFLLIPVVRSACSCPGRPKPGRSWQLRSARHTS